MVPIAVLAIEFGVRGGLIGATVGFALVPLWSLINTVHVNALGYVSRGAVMFVTGIVVGRFSDRLRNDIAERQGAQRDLTLYADQLEGSIRGLARSVERLEAFAEIARAVGGETELGRVLALILAHGRGIVSARTLVVYLPEGDELAAVSGSAPGTDPQLSLPVQGSLAGEVLTSGLPRRVDADDDGRRLAQLAPDAKAAILVPLVFRGETLGVLAAINGPDRAALRRRGRAAADVDRGQRRDGGGDGAVGRGRPAAAQPRGGRPGSRALGARAARRDAPGPDRRANGAVSGARARGLRPCAARPRRRTRTSARRCESCAT